MSSRFIHILILITIFLYSTYFFQEPFEAYIAYLVYLVLLPVFILKYGIPRTPFILFLPLLVSGILYIQLSLNTTDLFVKVFTGFFLSVIFYYYVFRLFDFEVKDLFKWYVKASVVVSIIGLIQIISYNIGFEPGYNFRLYGLNKWSYTQGGFGIRLNSIFSEPSYFAAVIAPAFFVSVLNLVRKKKWLISRNSSLIVIAAYILTFSSVGIIGIFLCILLLLLNFGFVRYAFVYIPLFYFSFYVSYNNIEEFRDRFDGTFDLFWSDSDNINTFDVHGSSFVLYNNWHIAKSNFLENPMFGTGLGSHSIAFDRFSLTNQNQVIQINNNKADANSMFLRLLSETGIYGVVFIILFVVRNYLYRGKAEMDEQWIISNALLLIILLNLLRQGHYFLNGFPFFLWMYYFNWKKNKALKESTSDQEEIIIPANPALEQEAT